MSKGACNWHKPDEQGRYACVQFENPAAHQAVNMFFNGAQITLRMEFDGEEVAHMKYPINFCPLCGERVRMEAVPGETD